MKINRVTNRDLLQPFVDELQSGGKCYAVFVDCCRLFAAAAAAHSRIAGSEAVVLVSVHYISVCRIASRSSGRRNIAEYVRNHLFGWISVCVSVRTCRAVCVRFAREASVFAVAVDKFVLQFGRLLFLDSLLWAVFTH